MIPAATTTEENDMAAQTGNIYISGTMTDSVEIPSANSRFSTMASSTKLNATMTDSRKR